MVLRFSVHPDAAARLCFTNNVRPACHFAIVIPVWDRICKRFVRRDRMDCGHYLLPYPQAGVVRNMHLRLCAISYEAYAIPLIRMLRRRGIFDRFQLQLASLAEEGL